MVSLFLAAAISQSGDPSGFCDHLNAARAQRGLPAVAHDAGAVTVAASNNAWQAVRGLGHHVLGGYGQCAGVGIVGAESALVMWSGSPAHAAIIFSPNLVAVGYHEVGGCCTVATSQAASAAAVRYLTYPMIRYHPARRGWRAR